MAAYQNGYMRSPYQSRSYSASMQDCPCQKDASYEREGACQKEPSWRDDSLSSFPVGMAYVPWQNWKEIYEIDKALEAGTIFRELEKPFLGRRAFKC